MQPKPNNAEEIAPPRPGRRSAAGSSSARVGNGQTIKESALRTLSAYSIPPNRLRFRGTIGEGSYGTAELANLYAMSWATFLQRPKIVVVKRNRQTDRGRRAVPLFIIAIGTWASCDHPNILRFVGCYLSRDHLKLYLVSPYMKNGNVKEYIAKEAPSEGRRLELVSDTIQGLKYLHSRLPPIIHGNMKPQNVLVNDLGKALLADMGLARAVDEGTGGVTTIEGFEDTIRYWSPELLKGDSRDRTSDIWAWGCLALEISTSRSPYPEVKTQANLLLLLSSPEINRTPEPVNSSSMHPELLQLLRRCWDFKASKRPDAVQCAELISKVGPRRGRGVHTVVHTVVQRPRRAARKTSSFC